ncbi:DUF3006 domain-containing protein [Haloimpatiens sp. FM7315]|uniref:DUF3006 domain-containing protein n=1 Tax=Haloimpatiens sp. FM7315 TaxID=3298609 RepID=UPI0035A3622C
MRGIIDRFEGDFAVIELSNGKMKDFERNRIPKEAKEGDVVEIGKEIKINTIETLKRKEEIEKLTEDMWE